MAQEECGGIRWIRHNVYNQGKYAVTIATSQSNQLSSESEVKDRLVAGLLVRLFSSV